MIEKLSYKGDIKIKESVIKSIVGESTMSCYGVVGMSSKSIFKDFYNEKAHNNILEKGVVISVEDSYVDLSIHVVLGYSIPVRNTCKEIKKVVAFQLDKQLNIKPRKIEIYVDRIDNIN